MVIMGPRKTIWMVMTHLIKKTLHKKGKELSRSLETLEALVTTSNSPAKMTTMTKVVEQACILEKSVSLLIWASKQDHYRKIQKMLRKDERKGELKNWRRRLLP